MKLDPKTFLALDSTISAVIDAAYQPVATKLIATLDPLIEDEKWASCHFAVDQLDLSGVVAQCRTRLEELAVAALMFGAHKQSGDITRTLFTTEPIPRQLHHALDQMEHAIEQDAAQQLRAMLHAAIDEISERVPAMKADFAAADIAQAGALQAEQAQDEPCRKKKRVKKSYEDDEDFGPSGRRSSYPAGYNFDRDYPGDALMYDNPRYQLQAGIGARPSMPNQPFEASVSGKEMLVGPSVVATSPNGYLVALGPWEGSERPLADMARGGGDRYGYDEDMGFYPDTLRRGRLSYQNPEDLRDRVPRYLARDPEYLRPNETIYPGGMPGRHARSLANEVDTSPDTLRPSVGGRSQSPTGRFYADDGASCGCASCNQLQIESFLKADKATYAYKLNQAVRGNGKALIDIGATMTTSRLINLGFLSQADNDGAGTFVISAVLDDKTCPVCQFMDGKIFQVEGALAHTMTALGASDPADLKSAAPWPKQDKASIAALYGMSTDEIMASGWFCPFHPNCRCTPERIEDQAHLQGTPDNLTNLSPAEQGLPEEQPEEDLFVDPDKLDAAFQAAVDDAAKVSEPAPIEAKVSTTIITDDDLREQVEAQEPRDREEIVEAYEQGDLDLLKDLLDTLGITYDEASLTPKE